jgi:6-phosphofructokinase
MHATILIPTRAHTLLSLAQVEARSARNGLGLVKLMGRQSGFIAMQASMASGDDDEHIHTCTWGGCHAGRARAHPHWLALMCLEASELPTSIPQSITLCTTPQHWAGTCFHLNLHDAAACAGVVDACLIPEVPFKVEKLCAHIQRAFDKCGHAVVCVAEGAGQVSEVQGEREGGAGQAAKELNALPCLHSTMARHP